MLGILRASVDLFAYNVTGSVGVASLFCKGDITMRRFMSMLAVALVSCAVLSAFVPATAHAQVVAVQITRPYTPIVVQPSYLPPVYVNPPGAVSYYPLIAPSYAATRNI